MWTEQGPATPTVAWTEKYPTPLSAGDLLWSPHEEGQPPLDPDQSPEQKQQIQSVLVAFPDLFSNCPRFTPEVWHTLKTPEGQGGEQGSRGHVRNGGHQALIQ